MSQIGESSLSQAPLHKACPFALLADTEGSQEQGVQLARVGPCQSHAEAMPGCEQLVLSSETKQVWGGGPEFLRKGNGPALPSRRVWRPHSWDHGRGGPWTGPHGPRGQVTEQRPRLTKVLG